MQGVKQNKERKSPWQFVILPSLNYKVFLSARKIQIDFNGGEVTSDARVMLLREADRRLGMTERLSDRLKDSRDLGRCDHSLRSLLRQRIYGICLGSAWKTLLFVRRSYRSARNRAGARQSMRAELNTCTSLPWQCPSNRENQYIFLSCLGYLYGQGIIKNNPGQ